MEFAKEHPEYNISLSGDYSNIQNYRYENELVSKIASHFGEMYTSDYISNGKDSYHNMQVYTENGENLTFAHDENFDTILEALSGHPEVKLGFQILEGELQIILSCAHTMDPRLLKEILNTIN